MMMDDVTVLSVPPRWMAQVPDTVLTSAPWVTSSHPSGHLVQRITPWTLGYIVSSLWALGYIVSPKMLHFDTETIYRQYWTLSRTDGRLDFKAIKIHLCCFLWVGSNHHQFPIVFPSGKAVLSQSYGHLLMWPLWLLNERDTKHWLKNKILLCIIQSLSTRL